MIRTLNNEYLLQYIWNYRLIPQSDIVTTKGLPVKIIRQGKLNTNNGPDFLNAEIEIDGHNWFGHVEIHLNASDWIAHRHNEDMLYENVILHVVLNFDCDIYRADGTIIPTLEVRKLMPKNFTSTYLSLIYNSKDISCANLQNEVPELHFKKWMETLAVQRIEEKTQHFFEILAEKRGDWDDAIYTYMAMAFGGSLNKESFELLTYTVPLKLVRRHIFNLQELMILIFYAAGYQDELTDISIDPMIQSDVDHFRYKYNLENLKRELWITKSLRPPNQPVVRLRQLVHFLHMKQNFLSEWLEMKTLEHCIRYFRPGHIPEEEIPGKDTINILIINAVVPVLYAYGIQNQISRYCELALDLLQEIPSESNAVTRKWRALGRNSSSALESQAMNQLRKKYCINKKCDQCAIGHMLLKRSELKDKEVLYERRRPTT